MDYLIRFSQLHEHFRKAETDALAELHGLHITWISYSDNSPFALVRFDHTLDPDTAAKALVSRSILSFGIYELWGQGANYDDLHKDVRKRTEQVWEKHKRTTFRFDFDSFHGSRTSDEQRGIIESFSYMAFEGPIKMKTPQNRFIVFEESVLHGKTPWRYFFGRLIAESGRKAVAKYDLKKRKYIATTSMDAELSLVTANMALARPGTLAYDPFTGTGSFPLACAHFGSAVFGSDLDGRSIRGKKGRNVKANFQQYGTSSLYLDGFAADVTNTPVRQTQCLDLVVCDPPYGVREGLKVLGSLKESLQSEVFFPDGTLAHLRADYIPPRRPYSFLRMVDDILDFSSTVLVENGRLCMWLPVAGNVNDRADEEIAAEELPEDTAEYAIPKHPALELVSSCTQDFNKWSRRLLTYRKLVASKIDGPLLNEYRIRRLALKDATDGGKVTASDLNSFRRKYFQGFKMAE